MSKLPPAAPVLKGRSQVRVLLGLQAELNSAREALRVANARLRAERVLNEQLEGELSGHRRSMCDWRAQAIEAQTRLNQDAAPS